MNQTGAARPLRLGVLISGGGTTLKNFLAQIDAGELQATIPLVVASSQDCGGIRHAREAGIPVEVIARGAHPDVESFSRAIFDAMRDAKVELVTLAGFLTLIRVPPDYLGRVMNIHPSLIPAFCGHGYYGHKVHEAALERGVKLSGCTVHFADNEYDHGPIIAQEGVPVLDSDTPDSLAARVFEAECRLYPECIRLFAEGRLEVVGRRVVIRAADHP
jgi:phosphoribosylglycinamide formyltransferase 1